MKDYSVLLGLWKALKAAGLAAFTLFLTALGTGGLDSVFNAFSNGLSEVKLPIYISIALVALLKFLHNLLKQYLASKVPAEVPPSQ